MNHKPTRPTVGPRGGRAVQATPCSECVSWRSCRPGAISEPWGCESWTDQDGRRALPDQLEPATACEACQGVPSECGPCGCPEVEEREPLSPEMFPHDEEDGIESDHLELGAFESFNAEPFRPAEPYRPDQLRGEGPAQSVLPMTDAGPLFAGCPEVRR